MFEISSKNPVAYFCAEYGLESSLPLYAGGLGVLAGDTIKEAADQNFPMVAVGLLYRGEGSIQEITPEGMQLEADMAFDPLSAGLEHVYVDEMPLFIKIHLTEIDVWTRCWKKTLKNNVTLYLLDTETDQNLLQERSITHALYSGTEESLMKQQLILGIGGVKLLHALDIHPSIYHINEGRPAFLHWQLIRSYMDGHGISYDDARKIARSKTVYTNHTLVSAGNQSYNIHLLKTYGQYYADKMGISIDTLLEPGMEDSENHFVMTRFALNTSRKASGVSEIHTQLSEKRWPEYKWVNVTNGVHMPTWQDERIRNCNKENDDMWFAHLENKKELANHVNTITGFTYDTNKLVIGWARRFAEYKRVYELFRDIKRLVKILKNEKYPVQLIIAGKAHRQDTGAKMLLQEVIHYMQNDLAGSALFIPNYNIETGQMFTKGCDLWLNTPIYGHEACGTSGMKAISNGVLQCTVKDGWTHEVDWHDVGWTLDPENVSSSFYHLMEDQIVPAFYHRDSNNVPQEWLKRMKKSVEISQRYSATRMLNEYKERLYS
jgi:glucan phosphorylase